MKYLPLILVAEDVPLNMMLIVAMLNQLIPDSEIVEVANGKQAVHVAERIKVDMIFMDIQMPEMDGLEATRMIRQMEHNNQVEKPVPIVAVTAFTLNKDKEKCFEAGMDEFLTKPIEKHSIYRMLVKYLNGAIKIEDRITSDEHVSHNQDDHFDLITLAERTLIEETVLLDLAKKAAENLDGHMQTLSDAILQANPQEIKNTSHAIKGIALNLNFTKLANMARYMEVLADEGTEKIKEQFQIMREEVSILKELFKVC
jgi:CheY-like chemotaxis protein